MRKSRVFNECVFAELFKVWLNAPAWKIWLAKLLSGEALQGMGSVLNLGYSHQVEVEEIDGITIDVPNPNKLIISGIDKQVVGEIAAEIRAIRKPEPYHGKGIRYANEVVRRKEGTAGKK